jgi:ParB family chromosome partitioning protein
LTNRKAEYLLIAENVERRGQAETDPIKKARIAQFLKEYWGVQKGNNQFNRKDQNGLSKIADTLDESLTNTKRLLKLNALIPEIQALVSASQLGTTAAEQLSYKCYDLLIFFCCCINVFKTQFFK